MMKFLKYVPLLAVIFMMACPAQAHHSFAMFDKEQQMTLDGVVSKVEWRNPHAVIFVDVTDENGETKTYTLECNSPNVLMRMGWKRSTLKVGDKVNFDYYPLRDGRPGGLLHAMTLPNGEILPG
jgi:hypothetical protein